MLDNEASNRDNDAVLDAQDQSPVEFEGLDLANPVYVIAKYRVSRSYGGPEEGGWWFTEGELQAVVGAWGREAPAVISVRRLNEAVDQDEVTYRIVQIPRLDGDADGVACHNEDGRRTELRLDVPRMFPEHGPHYC